MSGKEWELGQTSKHYETGGRGASTVSSGFDDPGGVSYGSYQMTSQTKTKEGKLIIGGTVAAFLKDTKYGDEFKGLSPGTPEFSAKWKEVAKNDLSFGQEQHDYIKRTHYDRLVGRLKDKGIDLSGRGPAVQDALWSTAVQYGPGSDKKPGGSGVFMKGLEEKFSKGYDLSNLSDKDIVDAIQDYKAEHVRELFPRVEKQKTLDSLKNRAVSEKADLLKLADQDKTVTMGAEQNGSTVKQLQGNLNQLHIPDAQGRPLATDGNLGPRTQQAIEAFQRRHGMPVDGKATQQLLAATQIAVSVTDSVRNVLQFGQQYGVQPNPPPGWAGVPHAVPKQAVPPQPNDAQPPAHAPHSNPAVPTAPASAAKTPSDDSDVILERFLVAMEAGDEQAMNAACHAMADSDWGQQFAEEAKEWELTRLEQTPGRDHPLFTQAVRHLERLGPDVAGYWDRVEMEQMAGAIAHEAKRHRLRAIDDIVPVRDGQGLMATWRHPANDVLSAHSTVDKVQAAAQPLDRSLQQLAEETQRQEQQEMLRAQERSQQQQRTGLSR